MKFCDHKFTSKDSRGNVYCQHCGRKKNDYIHQLETAVIDSRGRIEYLQEKLRELGYYEGR